MDFDDEIAVKQNRDPREKKLLDSKIRVKMRYLKRLSGPLIEALGEDESGYPVFVQTHDYRHTYTVKALRRSQFNHHFHANGRGFRPARDYTKSGKSSRIGMRRKQQWREEAHEALNS